MQEILSGLDISRKTQRIAHQLIENTFQEERVFIGGIAGNGEIVAQRIAEIVRNNIDAEVIEFSIHVNKELYKQQSAV